MSELIEKKMKFYSMLLNVHKSGRVCDKNMILTVDVLEKLVNPVYFEKLLVGELTHDEYAKMSMENCVKLYRSKSKDNYENLILLMSIMSNEYREPRFKMYSEFLEQRGSIVPIGNDTYTIDVSMDALNIMELFDTIYDHLEKKTDLQDSTKTLIEIWDKDMAPTLVHFVKTVCKVLLDRSSHITCVP